jgi:hypothetical protein
MAKGVLLLYTSPTSAEQEAEFNTWYDTTHRSEVIAGVGPIVGAQRFKQVDLENPDAPARYLCIWELDTDDIPSAAAALGAATPGFTMTQTMDVSQNPPVAHWFAAV